ncbi:hypothetical protein PAHAL_2G250000 [Panicum hallii]|uniref:Uncharacterized protein n=1 Tax=Panicum hallii TaxID=206008 RepID=A0A2T8KQC9_9POAL|nr:hypothetical protein PAHAL_2G250000 [Panicum hallii]
MLLPRVCARRVLRRRRPRQAVVGAEAGGETLAAAPLPDLGHGEAVTAREHLLALLLVAAAAARCGARAAGIAVPHVDGDQEVLVGEHVLVGAHGVAPPPVDAAAVAGARLGVAVGVREPAEPDGEHDAARGGRVWHLILLLLLLLLLLDVRPDGRRVRLGGGGEVARRELGAAERAGGAGAEPDVDAGDVERVAAGREQAEAVMVGELAEADGAVERPGRLLLPLPGGGGGGAGELAVRELRHRVDGGLVEPAAAGAGAVLVAREEEVLQLALPAPRAGVVGLEEEPAQDVEQARDEQHHGEHHRDEEHRGRDPRRHRRGGRGRLPPRRRRSVHRRRRRLLQNVRKSTAAGTEEVPIGVAGLGLPRAKPAARPPHHRGHRHLALPPPAPAPSVAANAAALIHDEGTGRQPPLPPAARPEPHAPTTYIDGDDRPVRRRVS